MEFFLWLFTVVGLLFYIRSVSRKSSQEIEDLRELIAQAHARIDVLVKRLTEVKREHEGAGAPVSMASAASLETSAVEPKPASATETTVAPEPAAPPRPPAIPAPPKPAIPAPDVSKPAAAPASKPPVIFPAAASHGTPASTHSRTSFPDVPVINPAAQQPTASGAGQRQTPPPVSKVPTARVIQPAKPAGKKFSVALEESVGTNWLPKLGVVILVLGIALLTASQWEKIAPIGRIALFYLVGGGMLAGGIWNEKRENFTILGRALIGGGWAALFFTTYAMYHVPTARVLDSLLLDLLLMLVCAALMVWHTLKYNSQLVTGLAFLLAFSTITISHESAYSLLAGAVLALALTVIVLKRQWYGLEIFGILASYLNHFYWLMPMVDRYGPHQWFPGYGGSVALVVFYWIVFRVSYVVRKVSDRELETLSAISALLNTILLLAVMRYQSVHPELAFYMLLILGAVELTLGQLPSLKPRRTAFLVLSTIGFCLLIGAVPFRYSGSPRAILWLIGAEAFLLSGIFAQEKVFRRFGVIAAYLVAGQAALAHVLPFLKKTIWEGQARTSDSTIAILFASLAVAFYVDANFCRQRWPAMFDESVDSASLRALSYVAGIFLVLAAYVVLPATWTGLAIAAFSLGFSWAGARIQDAEVRRQGHFFAALSLLDIFISNAGNQGVAAGVPIKLLTFVGAGAMIYLASYFVRRNRSHVSELMSAGYTWLATTAFALWAWVQFAKPSLADVRWPTAPGWILLALAVGYLGKRWSRDALGWQSAGLALLSFIISMFVNLQSIEQWHAVSIRLASTAFVAAGIYVLGRFCSNQQLGRYYSWPGTFLLAALAFRESPDLWLAPVWLAMAVALVIIARRYRLTELVWQAHLLSFVAGLRLITVNFDSAYRQNTTQLITCGICVALSYVLAWLISPKVFERMDWVAETYSFAGSLQLMALLWFQLDSGSVAIAWALAGVVLFEIGVTLEWLPLRKQGYLALGASFIRIFYADINAAGAPGEISPRVYTIVPLAVMYFYVYWRLHSAISDNFQALRKLKTEFLVACMGTAALGVLLRFEIAPDWVVACWAGLVLTLIAVCWFTGQQVFLWQALALLIPIAFRTSMHNFYQSREGLTSDQTWMVVAVTSALLLAALPLAFSIRERTRRGEAGGELPFISSLSRRPEQWLFFVPVGLITALLFIKMRSGLITLSWGVEGLLIFVLALFAGERSFRLTGLGLLLVCVAKILLIDTWNMNEPRDRYLTLIVVGALLLLVSFLYGKYRERLRAFL